MLSILDAGLFGAGILSGGLWRAHLQGKLDVIGAGEDGDDGDDGDDDDGRLDR